MIARHRASRCNRFDVLIRHLQPDPAKRTHRTLWIAKTLTVQARALAEHSRNYGCVGLLFAIGMILVCWYGLKNGFFVNWHYRIIQGGMVLLPVYFLIESFAPCGKNGEPSSGVIYFAKLCLKPLSVWLMLYLLFYQGLWGIVQLFSEGFSTYGLVKSLCVSLLSLLLMRAFAEIRKSELLLEGLVDQPSNSVPRNLGP